MTKSYRICRRCVMDTSDPEIAFDASGICNHCHAYDAAVAELVVTGAEAGRQLEALVTRIRAAGKGRPYDCIIGVSGGVDSTYVALRVKELGLRPLAVHLDNGWDSELAVGNIHAALTRLQIDLHTHVIDWEEFKDLQLAFLRASTPDSEIPSDHAIFSLMHRMADKTGVRTILTGINCRTESHLPRAWSQGHWDWTYIQGIHRKFGRRRLKTFPHAPYLTLVRWRRAHDWIDILNYLDYVKADGVRAIEQKLGWRNYGGKHHESIYTRFYQGWLLPRKFGFDKRRSHLSSLICSGQMPRPAALAELEQDPYPAKLQEEDRAYVIEKFGLTPAGFDAIMALPVKSFWDYPSNARLRQTGVFRGARAIYRAITGSKQ